MGNRPCKADPEPLYSVGDTVWTYNNVKRAPVKWTVKSRETTYVDDRLASARYTLERYNNQGQPEETLINVHPNEIYDSEKEVVMDHFDDMRQIIEADIIEIKQAADTMQKWLTTYF